MLKKITQWLKRLKKSSGESQKIQSSGNGNVNTTDKQESDSEERTVRERFAVEDTPFTIVNEDKDWFLTMGRYRISRSMSSKMEAIEEAKSPNWNTLLSIMSAVVKEDLEIKELRKEVHNIKQITKGSEVNENGDLIGSIKL